MGRLHKSISWSQNTEPESDNQQASPKNKQWESESTWAKISNTGFTLPETWSHNSSHHSFFLPVNYSANYEYPLLVWFHSNGFNEHQAEQVMPNISLRNYVRVGLRGTKAEIRWDIVDYSGPRELRKAGSRDPLLMVPKPLLD